MTKQIELTNPGLCSNAPTFFLKKITATVNLKIKNIMNKPSDRFKISEAVLNLPGNQFLHHITSARPDLVHSPYEDPLSGADRQPVYTESNPQCGH